MMESVKTGIEELDKVLQGGFLKGQIILVAGNPGSGKTTFAAQFLDEGLKNGEPGIFVGFVEPKEDFMKYMEILGFNFKKYEEEGKFVFIECLTVKDSSALGTIVKNILDVASKIKAKRLVLDSITALELILDKRDIRAFLHTTLLKALKMLGVTAVIIADLSYGATIIGYGIEEFIFDGVITLEVELAIGLPRRRLIIRKLRGKNVLTSHYDITIGEGGIKLIPPLIATLKGAIKDEFAKFNSEKINEMLGGGLRKGSITILVGPSGSGKTLLSLDFILNGIRNREKCAYVSYEEAEEQLKKYLSSMGATEDEVKKAIIIPVEITRRTPYEVYELGRRVIEEIKPERFVIDGLTAIRRMYNEEEFGAMIRKIASLCKEKGIALLMTIVSNPFKEEVGLSTIADNFIGLTLERVGDRIVRRIGVIKARGSITSEVMKTLTFGEGGKIIVQE